MFYDIVNENLEKWQRGEIFFDNLDNCVKTNKQIITDLYNLYNCIDSNAKIIMSGQIALFADSFGFEVDIMLPGGLRKEKLSNDFILNYWFNSDFYERDFIFIDDSYFSGRTAKQVEEFLSVFGCELRAIVVAYDGCPQKRNNLYSLYRYYDHHNIDGTPK